jgi:hypothetical protein
VATSLVPACGEFDRGTPGAIQSQLEKGGSPRTSHRSDPVAARPVVHQFVPSGNSDASGSRRDLNYSVSYYHDELAVIDTSAPDSDQVISIPDSQLYKGHKIGLPVDSLEVVIDEYFPNSALFQLGSVAAPEFSVSADRPHGGVGSAKTDIQRERTQHANCGCIGLARWKSRWLLRRNDRD